MVLYLIFCEWNAFWQLLVGIGRFGHATNSQKISKSTLNILSLLASSVLPIIVSDPLWTLPTSLYGYAQNSNDWFALSDGTQKMRYTRNVCLASAPSTSVMNSNAILVLALIGFVCDFTRALSDHIRMHLPIVLFPLLERASFVGNHSCVQKAAFASLEVMSFFAGYGDVPSLLAANVDFLLNHISLKFRRHARERTAVSRSLLGVVEVIIQSIARVGKVSAEGGTGRQDDSALIFLQTHVTMVGHMLNGLLGHLDRNNSTMSHYSSLDTVRVFRSVCAFMNSSIEIQCGSSNVNDPKNLEEGEEDWFRRLDFELDMSSAEYTEGTDSYDDLIVNDVDEANGEATPVDHSDVSHGDNGTNFKIEIDAVNSILFRCCYLLCYPDLQVQVQCCETILYGFQSLGKVGSFRKVS